jgi:HK97 family phage portal protein
MVENKGGSPAALYLRSPFRTLPWRDMKTGELVYKTTDTMDSHERRIPAENIIHVKGFSFDGIVGLSPVKVYAKETLGVDLAAQSYAAKFFANDSRPGGYLKAPGIVTDKQKLQSIASWTAAHTQQNTHKVALMDNGWSWEKVGAAPEEAQFIQTRQLNRAQIAAIFGVPNHMVGDDSDEPRANLEQKGIEFLNYTIRPWLSKWEHSLNAKLFPQGGKVYCKFDTTNLERTSFDVLLKGIQMARYAGLMTMNDGRKLLKLPPVVENDFGTTNPADKFWMPVNMYIVSEDQPEPIALDPADSQGGVGGADTGKGTKPPKNGKPAVNARPFIATFRNAFDRILARNKRSADDWERIFLPVLTSIAMTARDEDVIPAELAGFVRDYLRGMADRAAGWTKDSCAGELERALREIGKKSGEVAPQNGEGDDDEKGI